MKIVALVVVTVGLFTGAGQGTADATDFAFVNSTVVSGGAGVGITDFSI